MPPARRRTGAEAAERNRDPTITTEHVNAQTGESTSSAGGGRGSGSEGSAGMSDNEIAEQLLALAEESFEGTQAEWDAYRADMLRRIADGSNALSTSGFIGSQEETGLVGDYRELFGDLFGEDIEAADYVGDYSSQAGRARGDEWAMGQARDTLQDLRERGQEGITPIERLQMEMARRDQESQQRSSREAALRDMRSRGFGGSGMEMAALLGTQQETANRRALENQAAMAGAQQRSDRALGQAGQLGLGIDQQAFGQDYQRGQARDRASEFNNNLRADYDQYVTGTQLANREQQWGAGGEVLSEGQEASRQRYKYNVAPAIWGTESAGRYLSPRKPDTASTTDALKSIWGAQQAERAASSLEDDGFNLTDPTTWF
jgi:hypothetical protein